jgi:electron transfer flavoprotein alpha/beta subunit
VPDTETRIRIGDGANVIDPTGVKFIMSPYDEYAVEAGCGRRRRRAPARSRS